MGLKQEGVIAPEVNRLRNAIEFRVLKIKGSWVEILIGVVTSFKKQFEIVDTKSGCLKEFGDGIVNNLVAINS
jgi:hypothetical protein